MINFFIQKYKPVFIKHKLIILYVFFGGITTVVNYVMYYAGKYALINFTGTPVEYITGTATAIAWITAVLVAFITNKFYVFESKSLTAKTVMKELAPFFLARLLSFFLDLAMMVIGVDFLKINEFIIKTFSNIFVLIFNYIASKLFIFKKG